MNNDIKECAKNQDKTLQQLLNTAKEKNSNGNAYPIQSIQRENKKTARPRQGLSDQVVVSRLPC